MIRVVLIGLGIYLLYKLIFDLIIPIYRTTHQVRQQFNDIKAKMEQQNSENFQNSQNNKSDTQTPPKEKVGEYIDFEEIK
jgi:hypothetical protein